MRSLNTQDVIQIHPAHNFVNIDQFGMYVAPNERPTLWLSFSVFYVWKYEVPHPVKIEECFWWERALNYKICYEAINAINWVQTSALILLHSPEIPWGTKWDRRVTVAGVSMHWRILKQFFSLYLRNCNFRMCFMTVTPWSMMSSALMTTFHFFHLWWAGPSSGRYDFWGFLRLNSRRQAWINLILNINHIGKKKWDQTMPKKISGETEENRT